MVSFSTNTCKSANVGDHVSGTSKYTVSTCGHSLIHNMCTCMEAIIRCRWGNVTLRKTGLVQTAVVVVHTLYHEEGKKDSEVVGEMNWVHKCTPSNHLPWHRTHHCG